MGLEPGRYDSKSFGCLALRLWATDITSLRLCFLIYIMGTILIPAFQC